MLIPQEDLDKVLISNMCKSALNLSVITVRLIFDGVILNQPVDFTYIYNQQQNITFDVGANFQTYQLASKAQYQLTYTNDVKIKRLIAIFYTEVMNVGDCFLNT